MRLLLLLPLDLAFAAVLRVLPALWLDAQEQQSTQLLSNLLNSTLHEIPELDEDRVTEIVFLGDLFRVWGTPIDAPPSLDILNSFLSGDKPWFWASDRRAILGVREVIQKLVARGVRITWRPGVQESGISTAAASPDGAADWVHIDDKVLLSSHGCTFATERFTNLLAAQVDEGAHLSLAVFLERLLSTPAEKLPCAEEQPTTPPVTAATTKSADVAFLSAKEGPVVHDDADDDDEQKVRPTETTHASRDSRCWSLDAVARNAIGEIIGDNVAMTLVRANNTDLFAGFVKRALAAAARCADLPSSLVFRRGHWDEEIQGGKFTGATTEDVKIADVVEHYKTMGRDALADLGQEATANLLYGSFDEDMTAVEALGLSEAAVTVIGKSSDDAGNILIYTSPARAVVYLPKWNLRPRREHDDPCVPEPQARVLDIRLAPKAAHGDPAQALSPVSLRVWDALHRQPDIVWFRQESEQRFWAFTAAALVAVLLGCTLAVVLVSVFVYRQQQRQQRQPPAAAALDPLLVDTAKDRNNQFSLTVPPSLDSTDCRSDPDYIDLPRD